MPALPAAERARLEAVYRATTYRIHAPQGDIDLRIGEASAELDAMLRAFGVFCWAIVTAWNPRSVSSDVAANKSAQSSLEYWLKQTGMQSMCGQNLADNGFWPPEESLFVLGMSDAQACACGRRYFQNAVLIGAMGGVPQLLWCEET